MPTHKTKADHMFAIETCITELCGASDALVLMDLTAGEERSGVGYLAGQISTQVRDLNSLVQDWFAEQCRTNETST